jgi:hypothetical protein
MVDYRAVLLPADVASWVRTKFGLGALTRSTSSTKKAVQAVTYLEAKSARTASSVRRLSDSTCYYLLTFTNYDDGTSDLTNVDFLGCTADGSSGGDAGGSSGADTAASAPAHAGCSSVSKTAGTAMQNIFSSMPGIVNSTTQSEAYAFIYTDNAGNYFWDNIQTLPLNASGHATPNPAPDYPGYSLVGFVHTHPQNSGVDPITTDNTYNTHFSQEDFDYALSFNPPIAMFDGMANTDTANFFYQLNYSQNGTDANGNPTYKVTGENASFVSAAGC